MTLIAHPVPPALRPWLRSCVGYDLRTAAAEVHHGLPSTSLTVVLAFDAPLDCGWRAESAHPMPVVLGGLHSQPVLIQTHGSMHGMQLSLSPLGARDVLGAPAGAVGGALADPADLGPAFPSWLRSRLEGAAWPERFRLLLGHVESLVAAQRTRSAPAAEVAQAWRRILASGGQVRVDDLARDVGWSRRHLTERFSAELGATPKVAARVARFERALALARSGRPLADVATTCGYADQPHLNREWRLLAGEPPRGTLSDLPDVQDETRH